MPPTYLCAVVRCDVKYREVACRAVRHRGTISTVPENRASALLPVALHCVVVRSGVLCRSAYRRGTTWNDKHRPGEQDRSLAPRGVALWGDVS